MCDEKQKIIVYTDGSSTVFKDIHNLKYGGIGVYFENDVKNVSKSFKGEDITNQKMELTACIYAIKSFAKYYGKECTNYELNIYSDSMYVINCMTIWAINWKKNKWMRKCGTSIKSITNLNLIKKLYNLTNKYNVKYFYTPAHQKEPEDKTCLQWKMWFGNKMADNLATDGTKLGKLKKK